MWTHTLLTGDLEHYKGDDLSSWMFLRFDAITDLDPQFYEVYYYGGRYLSIIKDDLIGAESIYLKGLKLFPDDYFLIYYTAFNYYFEMKDLKNGIKYYKILNNHPEAQKINPGFSSMIAQMVAREGDLETAENILRNAITTSTEPMFKDRLVHLLKSLTAEKDLNCLNGKLTNCRTIDPSGDPYILENGSYKSKSVWRKFKNRQKKSPQ